VRTAKVFIEATQKLKCEDSEIIAKHNGKNELLGIANAPEYKDKFTKLVKPITKQDVDRCIRKYFKKEGMVVSVVSSKPPSEKTMRQYIQL
jgi:predicted Zn-dependent peptidase